MKKWERSVWTEVTQKPWVKKERGGKRGEFGGIPYYGGAALREGG